MIRTEASAEALGVVRFCVYGIWCVLAASTPLHLQAQIPAELFQPLGVIKLIPESMRPWLRDANALTALQIATVILTATAAVGLRPHALVALPAAACIFLVDGLMKGYTGNVNHAQMAPLYAAAILAFFPAADGFAVMGRTNRPSRRNLYGGAMVSLLFVFTLLYSLIGVRRFVGGGLDIFTGDAMPIFLTERSLMYGPYAFSAGLLALSNPLVGVVMKAGLFITTLCEALAPLVLVSRRFRIGWLLVMVPFHVLSLVTMNIFFWENLVLIAVLLTSLPNRFSPRTATPDGPILFFDGECGLCNRFVQWIISRDPDGIFRLAPLQGATASRALPLAASPRDWTLVLFDKGRRYEASTAVLRAVADLGGLWTLVRVFLLVPRALRDRVYMYVAHRRMGWFGRADRCRLPSAAEAARLLP